MTIPLDLRFSPSQNAQNFFKNYKKKQTAARMLVDLLAEGEKEIAYLETVLYEVESAAGEAALNEIRAELKSQGYLKYYKQRDKRQKPADFLRFTSSDGFEILVGRNNAQNDKLTLHTARGKDLWFHVQKAPGSHVVVMSRGEDIPDTTRQEAAELAVIYSSAYKAGTGAKVAVDTTEVKNIWKANGAKPGMVLYEVYTTVYITPRDGLEEQLKQKSKDRPSPSKPAGPDGEGLCIKRLIPVHPERQGSFPRKNVERGMQNAQKCAKRPCGENKKEKYDFLKNTCQMHADVIKYLSAAKGLCDTSRAGQRYA